MKNINRINFFIFILPLLKIMNHVVHFTLFIILLCHTTATVKGHGDSEEQSLDHESLPTSLNDYSLEVTVTVSCTLYVSILVPRTSKTSIASFWFN